MPNALILGFGGSGAQTLTFVKEVAVWKEGRVPNDLGFLLFDTIEGWKAGKTVQFLGGRGTETLASSRDEAANLDENREYFHLGDQDPNLNRRVTERALPPHLALWLHAQWIALHVPEAARNIKDGAAQQRQIGRFAIFQNAVRMRAKLVELFRATRATNVWLIGSAAGGTGAGGLLDAALLTRLAARDVGLNAPRMSGVVVLPDVYSDKPGISKGRAYAMLRELSRLQEHEFVAGEDAFRGDNGNITIRVRYDAADRITATRSLGGLFDCVFYVGKRCENDEQREAFFSSLATAIDPYLDTSAGQPLLQASVNEGGKVPSSFGASRIYLPIQTLADLYTWEEVQAYVENITAPKTQAERVVDVEAGPDHDRRTKAQEEVKLLLPCFDVLNEIAKAPEDKWKDGLNEPPSQIVNKHLQFANPQQAGLRLNAGDAQFIGHTYFNPYVSLTTPEDRTPLDARRLKTHEQFRKSGQKETLEESQQRFERDVEKITSAYRSSQSAEKSFVKGADVVRQALTAALRERVDRLVIGVLDETMPIGKQTSINGTVITRLYKLLEEMLGDGGPIANARAVLKVLRQEAGKQESKYGQELQQAQADLKEWTPSKWWRGGAFRDASDLGQLQTDVADAAAKAAEVFQRQRLLDLIAQVLDLTEERLFAWRAQARAMLDRLLLDPGTGTTYGRARGAIGELKARLERQATDRLAVIDPVRAAQGSAAGDPELNGYRAVLRQEMTTLPGGTAFFADLTSKSRWKADVDGTNQPRLRLLVESEVYEGAKVANLASDLHRIFRHRVDEVIKTKDIFDYLRHCLATKSLQPQQIALVLDSRAEALINLPNAQDEKFITYGIPNAAKRDEHNLFGEAIQKHLPGAQYYAHSDPFSICLVKVKKPADARDIQDVQECLEDYLRLQTETLKNVQLADYELRRAEVYHIFRAELEAWYIEREALLKRRAHATVDDHIPPRIVRLLDDPERMSAFVRCLATGVVREDEQGWWWLAPNGDKVPLNDPREGKTTVVRAAVNFILRGEGGADMGAQPILLPDVQRGVALAILERKQSEAELLREFAEPANLNAFLDRAFPNVRNTPAYPRERAGLKAIFEFYARPGLSTDLVKRML